MLRTPRHSGLEWGLGSVPPEPLGLVCLAWRGRVRGSQEVPLESSLPPAGQGQRCRERVSEKEQQRVSPRLPTQPCPLCQTETLTSLGAPRSPGL